MRHICHISHTQIIQYHTHRSPQRTNPKSIYYVCLCHSTADSRIPKLSIMYTFACATAQQIPKFRNYLYYVYVCLCHSTADSQTPRLSILCIRLPVPQHSRFPNSEIIYIMYTFACATAQQTIHNIHYAPFINHSSTVFLRPLFAVFCSRNNSIISAKFRFTLSNLNGIEIHAINHRKPNTNKITYNSPTIIISTPLKLNNSLYHKYQQHTTPQNYT